MGAFGVFWNVSTAKLIDVAFCYQSLIPENHVFPKDAATKYQGIVSFVQS